MVQRRKQLEANDENLVFNFDQLDFAQMKDSLRAYIFAQKIQRDGLNSEGQFFTAKTGEKRYIALRDDPSGTYQGGGLTNVPKYLYFMKVIGAVDPLTMATFRKTNKIPASRYRLPASSPTTAYYTCWQIFTFSLSLQNLNNHRHDNQQISI